MFPGCSADGEGLDFIRVLIKGSHRDENLHRRAAAVWGKGAHLQRSALGKVKGCAGEIGGNSLRCQYDQ